MQDAQFKALLRAELATRFPWLLDADEQADGGDTVETVMEMYTDAGGAVAENPKYCDCGRDWDDCAAQHGSSVCMDRDDHEKHGEPVICDDCGEPDEDCECSSEGPVCDDCGELDSDCKCPEGRERRLKRDHVTP